MPVNDPILLNAYAQMAEQAYLNRPGDTPNVQFGNSTYAEIGQVINQRLWGSVKSIVYWGQEIPTLHTRNEGNTLL